MFNAKTKQIFINKEDCEYLVNFASNLEKWDSGGADFWENRVLNYHNVLQLDKKAAEIMLNANLRCADFIKSEYNLIQNVYSDTLQIIRWFDGMEQPPHADDMSNTDIVGFDHRVFGSIIYLNDRYSGGHTYYPNFDAEVIPEIGKLAVHPGNPEHLHGVTKILNGTRYTIASFWTFDKEKSSDWAIY